LEHRIVNLAAVPEAAKESFAEVAPGPWLISRVPWTAAEHKIKSIEADAATAAALIVPDGTACLMIGRRT